MIRVLVLGYGPMGQALTQGVLDCPEIARVVGVFPWSTRGGHRHWLPEPQEPQETSFHMFLKQHRLPILTLPGVNHYRFIQMLKQLQPQVVFVGSWGEILKPFVLEAPGVQFINCHPSLLPAHRGPNPHMAVIRSGEDHTGITFHLMDQGVDTGPILLQALVPVLPEDTGGTLRARSAQVARQQVPVLLRHIAEGTLSPQPQPPGGSYDRVTPALGWIDWEASPEALDRHFRALAPWHTSLVQLGKQWIAFQSGQVVPASTPIPVQPGTIVVRTSNGVRVATVDPNQHVVLSRPQLLGLGLPALAQPLLSRFWLRTGHRFRVSATLS